MLKLSLFSNIQNNKLLFMLLWTNINNLSLKNFFLNIPSNFTELLKISEHIKDN